MSINISQALNAYKMLSFTEKRAILLKMLRSFPNQENDIAMLALYIEQSQELTEKDCEDFYHSFLEAANQMAR